MSEIYVSCDVETNGTIPGDFSMLSLGAAAFKSDGTLIDTFYATLDTLPGAKQDPDTMAWWATNQAAYDATRQNTQAPEKVMRDYVEWVEKLDGKPVFLAYPAGFDFLFCYWYMMHFVGRSPFSFSALDIKSYASAVLKMDYRQSTKKNMPKHWFPNDKHTHVAIDDAIEQGRLFLNMRKEHLGI